MSGVLAPAATNRVTLTCGGVSVSQFVEVTITRDLRDIAGSFRVKIFDVARVLAAAGLTSAPAQIIKQGMACSIAIDGTQVLLGWVDCVELEGDGQSDDMTISGRDKTGDLVDCAAAPDGPGEFKNMSLTAVAEAICAPFGIAVTAQTDVGANFTRLSLRPHDTGMAFLESAGRQRSTLLVSDGVGGLLLTVGGSSRGPAALVRGQNIVKYSAKRSWEHRFSDYYVKGQTDSSAYVSPQQAAMTHALSTLDGGADAVVTGTPAATILMTGHAQDPEVTRYRPTVRLTLSQSGMATTQAQAEWAARVAKGEANEIQYTVLDWRADPIGPSGSLWMPNTVVSVVDPMVDIDDDMLIAGVTWSYGEEGEMTTLRVVGVTAYDLTNLAAKHRPRKQQSGGQVLNSSLDDLKVP